ncbi:hypothetical protein D3C87_2080210 [compost metagenome]
MKNDGARPNVCKPIRLFKVRLDNVGSAKKPDDGVQACNRLFFFVTFVCTEHVQFDSLVAGMYKNLISNSGEGVKELWAE